MADRMNRIEREEDTREANVRPKAWEPSAILPSPKRNQDTHDFRYVRVSMQNEADNVNLSRALREGWEPVLASEYPELKAMNDFGSNPRFQDGVVLGGLLLCSRPKEIGDARRKFADEESLRQIKSVKENYMSDNDRRMGKFDQSETRIKSFG